MKSSNADPRFQWIYQNCPSQLAFMHLMNGLTMISIVTPLLMILQTWGVVATQLGTLFLGWIALIMKATPIMVRKRLFRPYFDTTFFSYIPLFHISFSISIYRSFYSYLYQILTDDWCDEMCKTTCGVFPMHSEKPVFGVLVFWVLDLNLLNTWRILFTFYTGIGQVALSC